MVQRTQLNLIGGFDQFDKAQAVGKQRRADNALSQFGAQAFQGDQNAINELFRANPQAAVQFGQIAAQRQAADRNAALQQEDLKFRREERAEDRAFRREKFDFEKVKTAQDFGLRQKDLTIKIAKLNKQGRPDPKFTQDLRKEFVAMSKDFIKVRDAFGRMQAISSNPNPEGVDDIGLIFNFMKMLDPGSVVRESEFRTLENAQGVPDQLMTFFNKLKQGEKLAPGTRQQIVDSARRLFQQQEGQQNKVFDTFERLAENAGINKEDVALDIGLVPTPQETPAAPQGPAQGPTPQQGAVQPPREIPVGATATGPNGARIQWDGQQWIPLQ